MTADVSQRIGVWLRGHLRPMYLQCVLKTSLLCLAMTLTYTNQRRSKKFILGGYNLLLHDTTVLYTSSLTTSAAISAHNNFQGLILGGYIYRYTPRRYAPNTN